MSLQVTASKLSSDLDTLDKYFRDFAATKASIASASNFSLREECLLEGLLSRAWQAWCTFCRSCVIESCIGTVDATGTTVPPLPDATSDAHVSGAAIRAHNKTAKPPYWGNTNTVLRLEPTWGDIDVLVNVLQRLRPANVGRLLPAFSSGSSSAKALQLIRNAAAHTNVQSLGDVQRLRSRYIVFPIRHPTHALFWIDPSSKDFLATQAIDELKDAAASAVCSV
jgi:hypothetical protein